jgi:hypothetical protein
MQKVLLLPRLNEQLRSGWADGPAQGASMRTNSLLAVLITSVALTGCAHHSVATVLPQRGGQYEIVAQAATERAAYENANSEAAYTCEEQKRRMVVVTQSSVYQGADKNERDDVNGGNVALAIFTGRSGKERQSDDYKVTLLVECL